MPTKKQQERIDKDYAQSLADLEKIRELARKTDDQVLVMIALARFKRRWRTGWSPDDIREYALDMVLRAQAARRQQQKA